MGTRWGGGGTRPSIADPLLTRVAVTHKVGEVTQEGTSFSRKSTVKAREGKTVSIFLPGRRKEPKAAEKELGDVANNFDRV